MRMRGFLSGPGDEKRAESGGNLRDAVRTASRAGSRVMRGDKEFRLSYIAVNERGEVGGAAIGRDSVCRNTRMA